jgi:hypothetical protein
MNRKPAKGLINNMRRQRQSWPSALVRRLLNCPSAPRAQASGPFDMRGIRAAPFGKLARSRRPDSGYPGDTALSRLIGAPDAHQRDLGAANCRASCCAQFSWHGRRGGRLRGRAHCLRQPASARPSGSATPPPSARRACRGGQRTPVAPAPILVPGDTDVPARPRPGNQDVHHPRAGRRDSSQPTDRSARSPRLRRRAHPASGRR